MNKFAFREDKLLEWKINSCMEIKLTRANEKSMCIRNDQVIHEGPFCKGCPYEFMKKE